VGAEAAHICVLLELWPEVLVAVEMAQTLTSVEALHQQQERPIQVEAAAEEHLAMVRLAVPEL
jgi:hypothetical protein